MATRYCYEIQTRTGDGWTTEGAYETRAEARAEARLWGNARDEGGEVLAYGLEARVVRRPLAEGYICWNGRVCREADALARAEELRRASGQS